LSQFSSFGTGFWSELETKEIENLAHVVDSEPTIESFWMAEIPHYRTIVPLLADCAVRTERVKLGLGILGSHTRHPATIAMDAATLSEMSSHRLILGLGAARTAGNKHSWKASQIDTMRDAVAIIRQMFDGKTVDYSGPAFEVNSTELGIKVPKIPIYIGTFPFSERMLRLSAAIADGILLVWTNPRLTRHAVNIVRDEAKKIGRDPNSVDIASYLIVSVDDDREKARAACKPLFDFYARPERARKHWIRHDAIKPDATYEDLLDTFAIAGSPNLCVKGLEELKEAGLRTPIFYQVMGPDPIKAIRTIAREIIPSFS
jgi:5,10-methylenetetrahydromethanopterin reductase